MPADGARDICIDRLAKSTITAILPTGLGPKLNSRSVLSRDYGSSLLNGSNTAIGINPIIRFHITGILIFGDMFGKMIRTLR